MLHGVEAYFIERARNGRRVALLAVLLGLALLGLLQSARTPLVSRMLRETLHFGYEGPERHVERIILVPPGGRAASLRDVGQVIERSERKGGSATARSAKAARALPETRPRIPGPGDALEDLLARAYARRSNVPIVQSQDLIIDHLVRPVYPEHARENNVEGRVAVMALVDTGGRVVEVSVLEGTAAGELREAASEAVWQCRFRPYRVRGERHEVYALFRFNFTIY